MQIVKRFYYYSISILFLTNVFIYSYKTLLKFLNYFFPPRLNPDFYARNLLAPEPYEIPLYLALAFLMVILIFFWSKRNFPKLPNSGFINACLLVFLLTIFLISIGKYPMKNEVIFIESLADQKTTFSFLIGYFLLIATAILFSHVLSNNQAWLYLFLVLIIGFLTFEPRFPSSAYDLRYFIGPIYEISHGKTIFTQTGSQYGFLSILILSLFTKLGVFDPFYLPALIWILLILEYFIFFYIIHKASNSLILSLIGLFSLITVNFFSLYHPANSYPQIGPMRWLPLIISVFLVQKNRNLENYKLILSFAVLSLWNVEVGVALILTYGFSLLMLNFIRKIKFKGLIRAVILYLTFILLTLIFLDLIQKILKKPLIDYFGAFTRLREYAVSGIAMIPIPWHTYFWFVILSYAASMIYFFKKKGRTPILLLFTANLMLFASNYYVGRSHPHNLFHISLFFFLNTFLLLAYLMQDVNIRKINQLYQVAFYLLLAIFFLFLPALNRKEAIASNIKSDFDGFTTGDIFKPETERFTEQYFSREAELIRGNLPQNEILLLSVSDSNLLYLTGKNNLILENPQSGLGAGSKYDLDLTLRKAKKVCPDKIAADSSLFGKPNFNKFAIEDVNVQQIMLDDIEKTCRIKYRPTECTNIICIATAKL